MPRSPPVPYADPQKQKEAQARWYQAKYERDADFRAQEANRKAEWLKTEKGNQSNIEASDRYREKKAKKRAR